MSTAIRISNLQQLLCQLYPCPLSHTTPLLACLLAFHLFSQQLNEIACNWQRRRDAEGRICSGYHYTFIVSCCCCCCCVDAVVDAIVAGQEDEEEDDHDDDDADDDAGDDMRRWVGVNLIKYTLKQRARQREREKVMKRDRDRQARRQRQP